MYATDRQLYDTRVIALHTRATDSSSMRLIDEQTRYCTADQATLPYPTLPYPTDRLLLMEGVTTAPRVLGLIDEAYT